MLRRSLPVARLGTPTIVLAQGWGTSSSRGGGWGAAAGEASSSWGSKAAKEPEGGGSGGGWGTPSSGGGGGWGTPKPSGGSGWGASKSGGGGSGWGASGGGGGGWGSSAGGNRDSGFGGGWGSSEPPRRGGWTAGDSGWGDAPTGASRGGRGRGGGFRGGRGGGSGFRNSGRDDANLWGAPAQVDAEAWGTAPPSFSQPVRRVDPLSLTAVEVTIDGIKKLVGQRILVAGLSDETSWQTLKDHLRQAGEVSFCRMFSGGRAMVEFVTPEDAARVITELQGSELEGSTLFLREDREDTVLLNTRRKIRDARDAQLRARKAEMEAKKLAQAAEEGDVGPDPPLPPTPAEHKIETSRAATTETSA